MKKCLVILLILLSGIATLAETNEACYERFIGSWIADNYTLILEYQDDEMTGMLTHDEESGDRIEWRFTHCEYISDGDYLWCTNCIFSRKHIDINTSEWTEEDWWLTDLSDIYFAFGEEKDTLIGYGIDGLDGPLVLRYWDFAAFMSAQ